MKQIVVESKVKHLIYSVHLVLVPLTMGAGCSYSMTPRPLYHVSILYVIHISKQGLAKQVF